MFTLVNGSCPLTAVEWTNLETAYCKNGGKYHCIPNENGQLGQVCTQAIWIQPYACPIFNTKTQKMDARLCDSRQPGCQIFNDYRSNRAYEYPACFYNYITTKESTTLPTSAESVAGLPAWAVAIIVLLLGVIALVTTLVIWRCRIKKRKDLHVQEEESMLLPQDDPAPEIQRHEEDNSFYAGIEAVAEGWKKLTQYGVVILVGVTGAGKTKCGLELLSMVHKDNTGERKYKSYILRNFDDFEKFASSEVQYCLFLDICLDRWSYSGVGPSIKNDIIRLENVFTNYIRGKNAQVVLTVNLHTWNRFAKFFKGRNFFRAEHIISVGSLSYKTKMEVLKKHLSLIGEDALEERQSHTIENEHGQGSSTVGTRGQLLPEPVINYFSTVTDVDKKIQGGETKHAGNYNSGGKDRTDVDSNPQKLKVNTSEKCQADTPTSKPSARTVTSNTHQSNRQSPRDLKGNTDACSSGKILKSTSSHIKAGEDTQEKNVDEEAKEDSVHSIGCKSKLVKQSGKGGPTQVPTAENNGERRYKVDEKMIAKLTKEPWKENLKIGFQPTKPFSLGFPEACVLYSRDDKILEKGEEFFKDPINCLSKRFSEWRDSKEIKEREKYVALVYMLMNGGYMDIRSIKGELLNVARSFCKDGDIINEEAVKEGVADLLRSYCVEKSPGCFEFQHEVIEYTLLAVAVSKHPKKTFENCDLNVLKRYMITKKNEKPEGELKVPVDSDFFELLADRFVMSTVSLENHRCMEDKRFERKYKTHPGTAV